MRIRTIKPEFWSHEDIADLAPICRLLFIGLWSMADRRGRLEDRPRRIKASVLPYDEADIDDLLNQLHAAGFIIRYTLNELELIQVVGFEKHQRINGKEAETESEYPEHTPGSEREAPGKHPGSTREAVEITGREGKGREGKGKEGDPACAGLNRKSFDPSALTIPDALDTPEFRNSWEKWVSHRMKLKSVKGWEEFFTEQLNWLVQYGTDGAIGILNLSTLNRYQGLFPPKAGSGQRTPNQNGSKRVLDTQPQIEIPEFK